MALPHVSIDDVHAAAQRIAPYVNRTPVATSQTLRAEIDADVYFKLESQQKIGAFKARG
ncbi:MAG: threonine/serine dehydratase, partial [Acidimicrobiia bacterium]|nr:threonine/serine dehydratase [Acidimicrobiia bacterium]